MHNQFKTQKFKHLMLAMGPRDLNSAPYSPVHCSSHSMTSFQSSELTELPVVENRQLFAQRGHSVRTAHGTPPKCSHRRAPNFAHLSLFPSNPTWEGIDTLSPTSTQCVHRSAQISTWASGPLGYRRPCCLML